MALLAEAMDTLSGVRAVQALEGEPGKVARAGADTTQRRLGHALGGKAGNEAVAQVAHAADVDVAHRVVVGARKDGEEAEVQLPSWGCEGCRLPSCICDSSCLAAPMGLQLGQQVDLGLLRVHRGVAEHQGPS